MIRCRFFFGTLLFLSMISAGLLVWAGSAKARYVRALLPEQQELVRSLGLTDLALWTEARYTRHPAMSDLFSPFQDHPAAFEHFPAGGLVAPTHALPITTLQIRQSERR